MSKKYIICILLLLPMLSFSQRQYVYTSLEAIEQPDSVFILSLSRHKLDSFPTQILDFTNLRELDLSKNRLKIIPPQIGGLSNLEVLNLDRNRLESLPEEIGLLHNLRYLKLSRNRLYSLPIGIGDLSNLKELILWSNGIKYFPESFRQLDSTIEVIDLRNNPMMLYDDQQAIKEMLPTPIIKMDKVCNCQ